MLITLKVNGQDTESNQSELSLLNYLRDTLHLTGTKCGCEDGTCGSCTVIIDGEAVRSCLVKLDKLNGKSITTIEGLSKDGQLHPLQKSFIECSAIQCGFCTPGLVLAAKAFLDNNTNPSKDEIIKALSKNLCRCGSYPRLIEAVQRAAKELRGEPLESFVQEGVTDSRTMGLSVPRKDVLEKVKGETKFVGDLYFDQMLHGKVVWSEYPSAEITYIDTEEALSLPGVKLILTSKDIPHNRFGILEPDQFVLAEDRVRYIGEPVAVVFAEDLDTAAAGAKSIKVGYKELPGVFSIGEALSPEAPQLHEQGNKIKQVSVKRGDLDSAFEQADIVVEEEFSTPHGEVAFIETGGAVATPGEDGKVIVYACNQSPFTDRQQLAKILGLGTEKVRIVHLPAGGAFGGKTELTVHAFVAIAALRTGLPAKIILTRKESLRSQPKRHAYNMKYRIAAKSDGKILGMDVKLLADGGAYLSWSPRVLPTSVIFSTGPYYIPNMDINATNVFTNNLVSGAMRGFGASQILFAVESLLDMLSRKANIDPITLRERNALDIGLPTTSGQILTAGVSYKKTLEAIKKAVNEELLPLKNSDKKIGIGIASAWRSVSGSIGVVEEAGATLQLLANGKLVIKVACTDMGQGTHTALCQIASDIVGIKIEDIQIVAGDTEVVPYGGAVMASRGLYMWGHAVTRASENLLKILLAEGASLLGEREEDLNFTGGAIVNRASGQTLMSLQDLASRSSRQLLVDEHFTLPKTYPLLEDANESCSIDPELYRTNQTINYNTTAILVEVDEKTGKVKVIKVIVAVDAGKIINPEAAKTQVEGAVIMGMGFALTEEFLIQRGINLTDSLGKYRIPRISVTPEEIKTIFVDANDPSGPQGAKGVGEIGLLAIAPAITNAIYDAIGLRINSLPVSKHVDKIRRN